MSYVVDRDAEIVGRVASRLEARNVACFVDRRDISDAAEWKPEIENALLKCGALVAFVRDEFHASEWTDHEVGFALGRQCTVVPVIMSDHWKPYGFFRDLQGIRGASTDRTIADRVYQVLLLHPKHRSLVMEQAIEVLQNSREHGRLADIVTQLTVSRWDPGESRDLLAGALDGNPALRSDPRLRRMLRRLIETGG